MLYGDKVLQMMLQNRVLVECGVHAYNHIHQGG